MRIEFENLVRTSLALRYFSVINVSTFVVFVPQFTDNSSSLLGLRFRGFVQNNTQLTQLSMPCSFAFNLQRSSTLCVLNHIFLGGLFIVALSLKPVIRFLSKMTELDIYPKRRWRLLTSNLELWKVYNYELKSSFLICR